MKRPSLFTPLDPENFGSEAGDEKRVYQKQNKNPVLKGGDLTGFTIEEAGHALRSGAVNVRDLVSDCLSVIHERDRDIHAFLDVYEDALREAEEKDAILRDAPETSPLFGIPIALKDNILVEGKRATAGSKILENYTAGFDATVVRKLKEAGAIIIGKTNLDEFAMGSSTENSAFGPTKNPCDESRVPGGSSGGSAAAVATGMALGALGSDTGGSIRQPASFCGVVGMKPTYGRVSRHGLIAMASSLDQIGPFAKTVRDAEIMFSAIAGGDEFDATSVHHSYEEAEKSFALRGLRIGVPKEYFREGLDPAIASRIGELLKLLEKEGVVAKEISLPHSSYALPAYYIVVPSEVSANLARFDGIRYGVPDREEENLFEMYSKTRARGFGPEVKRRIILGTYALSAGYYDAYYVKAQKVRREIASDFESAFRDVDIVIGPTTPTPAFRFGEKTGDPVSMYLADIYTVAVNLAGLPGISLPVGTVPAEGGKKLPFGMQMISPWFDEKTLFGAARGIERILASSPS